MHRYTTSGVSHLLQQLKDFEDAENAEKLIKNSATPIWDTLQANYPYGVMPAVKKKAVEDTVDEIAETVDETAEEAEEEIDEVSEEIEEIEEDTAKVVEEILGKTEKAKRSSDTQDSKKKNKKK